MTKYFCPSYVRSQSQRLKHYLNFIKESLSIYALDADMTLGWDVPEGLVYRELVKEYSGFDIDPEMVKESALEFQYLQLMWCLDPKNRTKFEAYHQEKMDAEQIQSL
ncbi:uncharacterized protein STEHIDRAFT_121434 [Stereum hirsutum FP-91666 SS1]|uniref:uncharacterized protein n=1 Tax=Stereum hirsutum (strain FP-91666) TaxID=721885 RepID=UPI000440BBC1|nr:uncharacterized protein STEHIDRAFT_121434 [Stereum hirsutum FP-91666 SS1]EIM86510.1 hypothetical protein STEHIDRAFT_121434 [Stereum hirsutum FP-91666 SS1]